MMIVKVNVQNRNRLNENDAFKQAFLWRRAFGDVKDGARKRFQRHSPLAVFHSSSVLSHDGPGTRCVKKRFLLWLYMIPFLRNFDGI